ncbi:hypothetical protein L596_000771 [Steinernema carpocapsae]|uniref:Uncharacterized protein n=1 Tax=Steinernema carpocapsae TaxID=34508 RepID=A0A4U8ULJ4_STECR|nr:hypothetical protein L596_000771 [Steinernema carpocapsae]
MLCLATARPQIRRLDLNLRGIYSDFIRSGDRPLAHGFDMCPQEWSPIEFRGTFSFLGEIGYSIVSGVFSIHFLFFVPNTPQFLTITRNHCQAAL